MKSYYAIEGLIRYYGLLPKTVEVITKTAEVCGELGVERPNIRRWKEPPHEVMANLPNDQQGEGLVDLKALAAFVRKHGPLFVQQPLGGDDGNEERFFCITAKDFTSFQHLLRRAWRGEREALETIESVAAKGLSIRLSVETGGLELQVGSLWPFISVLFLRDYAAGKAKICENAECPNPYFLRKRKGQRYCAHKCAVLVAVHRFREAQKEIGVLKARRKHK